jgi:hypothetical protein
MRGRSEFGAAAATTAGAGVATAAGVATGAAAGAATGADSVAADGSSARADEDSDSVAMIRGTNTATRELKREPAHVRKAKRVMVVS